MDFYLWKRKRRFEIFFFKFVANILLDLSYVVKKVSSLLGEWKSLRDFIIFNVREVFFSKKKIQMLLQKGKRDTTFPIIR